MSRPCRTRAGLVVGVACLLAVPLAEAASAQFRDVTASSGLPVSTAQLAAPSDPKAAADCVLVTHKVDLQWTATPSSFASGYRIYRRPASGSTLSLLATVSGRTTTTYVDSTVAAATSYVYVVEAYRGGWSAASAGVGVTTRSFCLL